MNVFLLLLLLILRIIHLIFLNNYFTLRGGIQINWLFSDLFLLWKYFIFNLHLIEIVFIFLGLFLYFFLILLLDNLKNLRLLVYLNLILWIVCRGLWDYLSISFTLFIGFFLTAYCVLKILALIWFWFFSKI